MDFQWVPVLVDKGQLQGFTPRLKRRTSCPILDRAYLSRKHLCFYQLPIALTTRNTRNEIRTLTESESKYKQSSEWNQPNVGTMSGETIDNHPYLGNRLSSYGMKQSCGITNGNTNLWCSRWGDRRSSSSESMFTAVEDLDPNSLHSSEISLSLFHTLIVCDVCGQQPCTNHATCPQNSEEQGSLTQSISEKDLNLDTTEINQGLDGVAPCKYTLNACDSGCKSFYYNTNRDLCELHTCEIDKTLVSVSTTARESSIRPVRFSVLEEDLPPGSECRSLSNLEQISRSRRSFILDRTEIVTQMYSQGIPKSDLSLCDTPSITWLYYDDEYLNRNEYFYELQYPTEDLISINQQNLGAKREVHRGSGGSGYNASRVRLDPTQCQNSAYGKGFTTFGVHDDVNSDYNTVSRNNSLDGMVPYRLCSNANQASDRKSSNVSSETGLDTPQFAQPFSSLGQITEEETVSLAFRKQRASLVNDGSRPSLFSISGVVVDANELESIMDVPAEFTAAEVYLRRAMHSGSIIEKDNSACDPASLNKLLPRTAPDSAPLRSSLFRKSAPPVRDDTLTENPSFAYGPSRENLASDVPESAFNQPQVVGDLPPPSRQNRSSLNLIYTPVRLTVVEEKVGSLSANEASEQETNGVTELSRKFTTQSWATIDSTEISRGLKLPGGLEKSVSEDTDTSAQSVNPVHAAKAFEPQTFNLIVPETVECVHSNSQLGTFTFTPALHNCNLVNRVASTCYRRTVSPDPAQFIKLMKKLASDRTRSKRDRFSTPGKFAMY